MGFGAPDWRLLRRKAWDVCQPYACSFDMSILFFKVFFITYLVNGEHTLNTSIKKTGSLQARSRTAWLTCRTESPLASPPRRICVRIVCELSDFSAVLLFAGSGVSAPPVKQTQQADPTDEHQPAFGFGHEPNLDVQDRNRSGGTI
jgi:hypothetical protein